MANNKTLKDGLGNNFDTKTTETAGINVPHVNVDNFPSGTEITNEAGNPVPVNEKGELLEATEALRMAINTLTKTIGFAMPDTAGRLRVLAENPTPANLQVTAVIAAAQTLATLTTLTTLSNQTSMGGFAANDQIPALMNTLAVQSRRNISVT